MENDDPALQDLAKYPPPAQLVTSSHWKSAKDSPYWTTQIIRNFHSTNMAANELANETRFKGEVWMEVLGDKVKSLNDEMARSRDELASLNEEMEASIEEVKDLTGQKDKIKFLMIKSRDKIKSLNESTAIEEKKQGELSQRAANTRELINTLETKIAPIQQSDDEHKKHAAMRLDLIRKMKQKNNEIVQLAFELEKTGLDPKDKSAESMDTSIDSDLKDKNAASNETKAEPGDETTQPTQEKEVEPGDDNAQPIQEKPEPEDGNASKKEKGAEPSDENGNTSEKEKQVEPGDENAQSIQEKLEPEDGNASEKENKAKTGDENAQAIQEKPKPTNRKIKPEKQTKPRKQTKPENKRPSQTTKIRNHHKKKMDQITGVRRQEKEAEPGEKNAQSTQETPEPEKNTGSREKEAEPEEKDAGPKEEEAELNYILDDECVTLNEGGASEQNDQTTHVGDRVEPQITVFQFGRDDEHDKMTHYRLLDNDDFMDATREDKEARMLCVSCMNTAGFQCKHCHSAHYCSEVCLNADWELHKNMCQQFSSHNLPRDPYFASVSSYFAAQILRVTKSEPELFWARVDWSTPGCRLTFNHCDLDSYLKRSPGRVQSSYTVFVNTSPAFNDVKIGHALVIIFFDKEGFDIEPQDFKFLNQGVNGYAKPGHHRQWLGPVIAFAAELDGKGAIFPLDFSARDARHVADYFNNANINKYCINACVPNPSRFRLCNMLPGIKISDVEEISCKRLGVTESMEEVMIPFNVQEGFTTLAIAAAFLVGLKWNLRLVSPNSKLFWTRASRKWHNDDMFWLWQTCRLRPSAENVTSEETRVVEWSKDKEKKLIFNNNEAIGSVIVSHDSGAKLHPHYILALNQYLSHKLATNSMPTPSGFKLYWKNWRKKYQYASADEKHPLPADLPSPYEIPFPDTQLATELAKVISQNTALVWDTIVSRAGSYEPT